jgi:hypothetical protein
MYNWKLEISEEKKGLWIKYLGHQLFPNLKGNYEENKSPAEQL